MPPKLLFDMSKIDLDRVIYDQQEILKYNPQSYEMQQLDGLIWYDKDRRLALGYKDITDKEFWVRGHIPGRPIMPGVIMIESAAQLCSFSMKKIYEVEGFLGFAGIKSAKFRGTVVPGQRLHLLGQITKIQSRKFTSVVQGVVNGIMVFEAELSAMKV